ncbi:signal peptide peptidase SppA [Pararhizobium haloflavum]|uniref:signal peptide peptidase SppA n=1 Tax=Pararhizobium haloflavum TaxID=2037914 RepID=UPI000C175780|nr:signal peptide peptidase SppA [Pararhizobium haloflavum]
MDNLGITDRRRLRRKLTFWRIAAFVALVALVAGLGRMSGLAGEGERTRDHIARVEVSGVVTADEDLLERLEDIKDDPSVKALIVAIESPGGTTYGGERIYKAVRDVAEQKPVAAEVRGLAASAGYMIASATDHIVAGEASIVGSIGVLFQYGNVSELLDNLGISVDSVKSAPLKAEPSPFEPADPAAEEMIRALVMDSYEWFVDIVAERREMSEGEALALADGSIFTGRQALDNGLIDALGAEQEIRAFFEERSVPANLEIIEWEEEQENRFFFAEALAAAISQWAGANLPFGEAFEGLSDRKLFLDGLVSVWQFGGGQARDDWGNTP